VTVPIDEAEMNGDLRTASKGLLAEVLTENIKCLTDLPADDPKQGRIQDLARLGAGDEKGTVHH